MRITIPSTVSLNPLDWMRRQGYAVHRGGDGQTSFVRRLGSDEFPRLHAYVERQGDVTVISVHVDQKRPSYGGTSAHAGEYEGPLVEAEIARLQRALMQNSNVKSQI